MGLFLLCAARAFVCAFAATADAAAAHATDRPSAYHRCGNYNNLAKSIFSIVTPDRGYLLACSLLLSYYIYYGCGHLNSNFMQPIVVAIATATSANCNAHLIHSLREFRQKI